MNASNCPRCGRIFTKYGNSSVCDDCKKAIEEEFEKVRLYVKENPHSSAQEVSEHCEIPVKRILQFVREGKLEVSHGMAELITCTKCGRPIKTGRMCEKCVKGTTSALSNIIAGGATETKRAAQGMFTSNKY
jgi:NMD protein affecting ribosome stability and mRNA decay